MERYPLLEELLKLCSIHNIEPSKAYTTFEVYQELSEVRKFSEIKYFFSEELKLYYLTGKKETGDEHSSVFVPLMHNHEITLQEITAMQEILSRDKKQVYLFIRDRDSSSTCYCITKGLLKPDSPESCTKKRETELKKYQFEKNIQTNRKLLYSKALKCKKKEQT